MEFRFGFNGLWGPLTATLPGIGVRCGGGIDISPAPSLILVHAVVKTRHTTTRFVVLQQQVIPNAIPKYRPLA